MASCVKRSARQISRDARPNHLNDDEDEMMRSSVTVSVSLDVCSFPVLTDTQAERQTFLRHEKRCTKSHVKSVIYFQ